MYVEYAYYYPLSLLLHFSLPTNTYQHSDV